MKEKEEKKKVSFKQRLQKFIWKRKEDFKFAVDYFDKNPEKFGTLIAALFGITVGSITMIKSSVNAKEEKCKVSDYLTGACWVTEYPLTNEDWLKINDLMNSEGISLGQALNKLGYLKK